MCRKPKLKKNIFGGPVIFSPQTGLGPLATYCQPLDIYILGLGDGILAMNRHI